MFLTQLSFTFQPGVYESKVRGNYYRLKINEDSTYCFTHPSVFHRYLMTDTGKWRYMNDTLLLIDRVTHVYSKTGEKGEYIKGQKYISIIVVDEKNNPFPNIEVGLNYDDRYKRTDSLGYVKFEYCEIKKMKHHQEDTLITLVEIGRDSTGNIKYDDSGLKNMFRKQVDSSVVEMSIGNGEWPGLETDIDNEHANHFTVVLDQNPLYKREIRTRKFVVNNDIIIFENIIYRKGEHIIKLKKKK
jgi:hypothetical protein